MHLQIIYDRFQQEAIDHIKNNDSVIVSAPTGAGKTVIAEYVINDCISKNRGVIYTAPIKALSNQKFRDFRKIFKDKIGILTGDVSINASAPVLIMTTEIFRNKLLEGAADLKAYSWVIFDEIHYLDDYDRGTVWEESLIFLPKSMNILALSATIPNINEFAKWISQVHEKPLKIVKEDRRPVPLHFFYQCQSEILDDMNKLKKFYPDTQTGARMFRVKRLYHGAHPKQARPTSLIKNLYENNKLPCIYFCFNRARTELLANEMLGFDFLKPDEKEKIAALYTDLIKRFDLSHELSVEKMLPLIKKGIAYHHAGMLPTLKEVVEQLFTSRLIKVIFTTETFALGINMPARSVIFDELRKYYGRFFAILKTRDFYQMAGRAGRRGIDKEGFVYSRVNPRFLKYKDLGKVIFGQPESILSKFNTSYATLLNLYEKHAERLYEIYSFSFHSFQMKKKNQKKALLLMRAKVDLLKKLGYIKNGALTDKGHFAEKIFGYELPLTELYGNGMLEGLSVTELGLLCLALVFEPRKSTNRPTLKRDTQALCRMTEDALSAIHKKEMNLKVFPLSKKYYYHLAPCLRAWMNKENFDTILRYTNADEGEVIRYFRMTLQILREILDTPASESLKKKIKHAMNLINRDIIDAENQLRV